MSVEHKASVSKIKNKGKKKKLKLVQLREAEKKQKRKANVYFGVILLDNCLLTVSRSSETEQEETNSAVHIPVSLRPSKRSVEDDDLPKKKSKLIYMPV